MEALAYIIKSRKAKQRRRGPHCLGQTQDRGEGKVRITCLKCYILPLSGRALHLPAPILLSPTQVSLGHVFSVRSCDIVKETEVLFTPQASPDPRTYFQDKGYRVQGYTELSGRAHWGLGSRMHALETNKAKL